MFYYSLSLRLGFAQRFHFVKSKVVKKLLFWHSPFYARFVLVFFIIAVMAFEVKLVGLTFWYCVATFYRCADTQEITTHSHIGEVVTEPTGEATKLLYVQILFRHGDRSPSFFYPTDPNPKSFWEGNGKLTKLGKKQHYALGKYFRTRYENFSSFNPNEIEVISSDYDRTILSALSNLASFFAPTKEWELDENFKWQPIMVRYLPLPQDKIFNPYCKCPKAEAEEQRIITGSEFRNYLESQAEMMDSLSFHTGVNMTHLGLAQVYDTLSIQKLYNMTIPEWAEAHFENLVEVGHSYCLWTYKTRLLRRLRAGPLIKLIIDKMNKKIRGEIPEKKFQVYSAHDAHILSVLISLNFSNIRRPPYCSTLLFELHELQDGTPALRLLFLNSTRPETEIEPPHLLILEGCTEFCPLEYFLNYTREIVPDDWDKECQLDE